MLIYWYQGRYIFPQLYVHEQTQTLKHHSQHKWPAFVICGNVLETFSTNRVDPDGRSDSSNLTLSTNHNKNCLLLSSAEIFRSFFNKQCRPRSDCSCRSSLIWVNTVCSFTYISQMMLAKICSRHL